MSWDTILYIICWIALVIALPFALASNPMVALAGVIILIIVWIVALAHF